MDEQNEYTKKAEIEIEKMLSTLGGQKNITDDDLSIFNANVQFAHRLNLINAAKVRGYLKEIEKLEYTRRTQTGLIDDGYENPLEREIRYSKESMKRDIAYERELKNIDSKIADKSEQVSIGR